jgi:predicted porin
MKQSLVKKAESSGDTMRHPCVLSALLIASAPCLAQSGVTLYGTVDAGVRSLHGLSANNTPTPSGMTTSVSSGVDNTSVWGIRGQESLGGGWKAIYRLEGGINVDTGAQAKGDRLFDRQALVGVESAYGTLAVGRQPNLISDVLLPVDPLGKRFASFNPNINIVGLSNTRFGTHAFETQYGPSGYSDNFYRLDNTLKYTVKVGDWQARAAYSAGEVPGDADALSSHGVGLTYQRPSWVVSGATMQFRSRDGLPLDAWSLGAAVKAGALQLKANIGQNEADTGANQRVHQRVLSAGVSHPIEPGWLVTTAYYSVRREATGLRDDGFDRAFVFLEKSLAPRTTLYAEADYTTWRGDAAGGTAAVANAHHGTGLTLGLKQKF